MGDIPVVISTHRRAGRVSTTKHVANAMLCMEESQAGEYAEHHDKASFLVHPDSVKGLGAKRNWLYERLGDFFQLDDDVIGAYRRYRPAGGRRGTMCSPERAYEIIQQSAATAREMGAYLFGFGTHAHPLAYDPNRPFRFGGYINGGAFGLLKGSMISWPPEIIPARLMVASDHWVVLLNAYHHRYAFIDERYVFAITGTYTAPGGLREWRDDTAEMDGYRMLRKYFGDTVRLREEKSTQLTKKLRNEAKKEIRLPYNV